MQQDGLWSLPRSEQCSVNAQRRACLCVRPCTMAVLASAERTGGCLTHWATSGSGMLLFQGYSIEFTRGSRPDAQPFPVQAPSLLGMPYAAVHGPDNMVVGSTKRSGLMPAEAFADIKAHYQLEQMGAAAALAANTLQQDMAAVWAPLKEWHVAGVRQPISDSVSERVE
jgi:hypothetical protein